MRIAVYLIALLKVTISTSVDVSLQVDWEKQSDKLHLLEFLQEIVTFQKLDFLKVY